MPKKNLYSPVNYYKVIETKRETTFLGRNGTYKCTGLLIFGYLDTQQKNVSISPITSMAKPGRARITFPMEDIDKVIKQLVKIKEENQDYENRKKK